MNGVLIVNCNFCAKQSGLYISYSSLGNEEQDVDLAELQEQVEMTIGMTNIEIVDTRGIDYFLCSCGNYTTVREIKDSLRVREGIHKVVS